MVLFLIFATMLLSACANWGVDNQRRISCPINYHAVDAQECEIGTLGENGFASDEWEEHDTVSFTSDNLFGIFDPPGDTALQVYSGIANHQIPATYTKIYPAKQFNFKSDANYQDEAKCSAQDQGWGLCDSTLRNVKLEGGIEAELDYSVQLSLDHRSTAAVSTLDNLGTMAEVFGTFNDYFRDEMREAQHIPPNEETTEESLEQYCIEVIQNWTHVHIFNDGFTCGIRHLDVEGESTTSTTGAVQDASIYATQESIVCDETMSDIACAWHMQNLLGGNGSVEISIPADEEAVAPTEAPEQTDP